MSYLQAAMGTGGDSTYRIRAGNGANEEAVVRSQMRLFFLGAACQVAGAFCSD